MTVIWEMIAMVAALVGGLFVLLSFTADTSAPQAAALAAQGIGLAAIPYFIASMARRGVISDFLKKIVERDAE